MTKSRTLLIVALLLGATALLMWIMKSRSNTTTPLPTPTTETSTSTTTETVGTTTTVTAQGGITGTAMLGPTCPVVRNPPDPSCNDKPYQGTFLLRAESTSAVLLKFTTSAKGTFNLKVVPGKYSIELQPTAALLPRCSTEHVTVIANTYTKVTISCDTGIR